MKADGQKQKIHNTILLFLSYLPTFFTLIKIKYSNSSKKVRHATLKVEGKKGKHLMF